jgi:hypothetical protein
MAGKIDALLKLSIVVAVLLASSSVAYYHLIYLPERDARIDAAKAAAEQRRADETAAAEQRRSDEATAAEQRRSDEAAAAEQHRAVEKAGARMRYDRCLSDAQDNYHLNWVSNCNSKKQKEAQAYARCISASTNDTSWICHKPDASSDCSLPSYIADSLGADLNKARDRCLQMYKSGL